MARARAGDALFAVLVTVVAAGVAFVDLHAVQGHVDVHGLGGLGLDLALGAAATVPLFWRRRAPLVVLTLTGGAAFAATVVFDGPGPAAVGPLIALYTVATCCPRAVSLTAGWVVLCAAFVGVAVVRRGDLAWEVLVLSALVVVTTWLVGDNVRVRRAYIAQLEDRAARAEADRVAESKRAATAERSRIARELHDVVAHHVSVIAIQAGAARLVAESPADQQAPSPVAVVSGEVPAAGAGTLESIEATARQVLTELRRLLGVLRRDGADDTPSLQPQPGISSLDALIETVRNAGLPVEWRIEGDAVPLTPSVELSAYRIVQEALTNVLKHEGPVPTEVTVRYGSDRIEVEIVDTPTGTEPPGAPALAGGGHGIAGMRERVALFGGDLDVGRRPDGTFAVVASIPTGPGPQ